jgi:hypothetical protein
VTSRAVGVSLLILLGTIGCTQNVQLDKKSSEAAYEFKNQVYTNLRHALASTGLSARIYVQQGACRVGNYGYLLLPKVDFHPIADGQKGVEAIRYMFEGNSDVAISEESGIVRIWIGKVSDNLLETVIPTLTLTQHAQYYPRLPDGAVDMIMNAPEIRRAMMGLRLSEVGGIIDELIPPHVETDPHLPPTLSHITLDQALDSVAKTFGGIVSYEECRKSNGYGFIDTEFGYIPR